MRACLNCVWNQFRLEIDSGVYAYEGDCGHYDVDNDEINFINEIRFETKSELDDHLIPIFSKIADVCNYYEAHKENKIRTEFDEG